MENRVSWTYIVRKKCFPQEMMKNEYDMETTERDCERTENQAEPFDEETGWKE